MGKFRKKTNAASKKRWPKGQSCLANASFRKYREAARAGIFKFTTGGLTENTLKQHNAVHDAKRRKIQHGEHFEDDCFSMSQDDSDNETSMSAYQSDNAVQDDEYRSVRQNKGYDADRLSATKSTVSHISSYKSYSSYASDFSQCSNISFKKIITSFRPDSEFHKNMLSVLRAICQTIKFTKNESEDTGTNTEYYVCLLTMLEGQLSKEEPSEALIGAGLAVLTMSFRTVSKGVLYKTFGTSTKLLLPILKDYSDKDGNVIIPSCLECLGHALISLDAAAWNLSYTNQVFSALMNPFCFFTKIKWRKAAIKATYNVVKNNYFTINNLPNNPPADRVADFCKDVICKCLSGKNSTNIKSQEKTILHILKVMELCIAYFSENQIKSCCELVLQLLTLNFPIVNICSYQVVCKLFSHEKAVIGATLNAQLISALYDFQPSPLDAKAITGWLLVMQKAHSHLADVNSMMGASAAPKVFSKFVELWLSNNSDIDTFVTHGLTDLLQDVIVPLCESEHLFKQTESKIKACLNTINSCLSYKYKNVWQPVLYVTKFIFENVGKLAKVYLMEILKTLAEMYDSEEFHLKLDAEHIIGTCVKHMGPEVVLEIIPLLDAQGELNRNRIWLLPVLKKNVHSSTLYFWHHNIYCLIVSCEKNVGTSQAMALLLNYFWETFPSFCNKPTDIKANFKHIARNLGQALESSNHSSIQVMAGLRKLINYAKENERVEDLQEIARFDKNFLPRIITLLVENVETMAKYNFVICETIKLYLTIAKPETSKNLFEIAVNQYETLTNFIEENIDEEKDKGITKEIAKKKLQKQHILDFIKLLVPYQDYTNLDFLYNNFVQNLIEMKCFNDQKKILYILEEMILCDNETAKKMLLVKCEFIKKLLLSSLKKSKIPIKGAVLRCFHALIKTRSINLCDDSEFLQNLLPVVILSIKDWNSKCKATAKELIILIGKLLEEEDKIDILVHYLTSQLNDIEKVEIVSTSILAFTELLVVLKYGLGKANIKSMFKRLCMLFGNSNRDIVGSCLIFLMIYLKLPTDIYNDSFYEIMTALADLNDDCKNHFRVYRQKIFTRLIRIYTYDTLVPYLKQQDNITQKVVKNLHKIEMKKKANKKVKDKTQEEEQDSISIAPNEQTLEDLLKDSDDEDIAEEPQQKRGETYIHEEGDTIVDLTDFKTIGRITSVKPKTQDEIKSIVEKPEPFKTGKDGRLIISANNNEITEAETEATVEKFKNLLRSREEKDEDSDDDNSNDDKLQIDKIISTRKRKRSGSASVKSGGSVSTLKYKAGGSGIHRPTAANKEQGHSSKTKGDMKKKNKVEPYAYVPLRKNLINKRNSAARHQSQFKNLTKKKNKRT